MNKHTQLQISSQETIERCPHDSENPYSMISNALIRDEKISPACRWLIIYLLSNKTGWKIKVSQVATHVKSFMGRDSTHALFNEAIDAGYIKREEIIRPNSGGGGLKRYIYILSETPKFKKCFRYPENQDTGEPYTGAIACHNNIYKKEHKKNIVSEPTKSDGLTLFFIQKLKEINPKIRDPDPQKWGKAMDRFMKMDNRSEEEVKKVIEYILYQHKNPKREFTWSKAVASPLKLREHFAAIWLEMTHSTPTQVKQEVQDKKINVITENRKWMKSRYEELAPNLPDHIRCMISEDSIFYENKKTRVSSRIGYEDLAFKEIIMNVLRKDNLI